MQTKVECRACHKDLKNDLYTAFDNYQVGPIVCSKCRSRQQRYLSEMDMMLYLGLCCLLYILAVFAAYEMLTMILDQLILVIVIIVAVFAGIYVLTHWLCRWIYLEAPMKKEWKDFHFKEDAKLIQKRMRWQFILFMFIGYFFGTQTEYITYFYILIIAFTVVVLIKLKLLQKKERQIWEQSKHK